jgi:pyruvate kinase
MITGESAIGKYPVEAVKYLARTAEAVFSSGFLAF